MGTEEESVVTVLTLEENEKQHVIHVLKLCDGNRSKAARLLKIDRRSLYRRLERYFGSDHSKEIPCMQRGLRSSSMVPDTLVSEAENIAG